MSGPAVLPCSGCDSNVWSTVTSTTSRLGWVWFWMCACCCLCCGILPFCANIFKVRSQNKIKRINDSRVKFPFFPGSQPSLSDLWSISKIRKKRTWKRKILRYCNSACFSRILYICDNSLDTPKVLSFDIICNE